jgi:parallel beta-helix repeat protein
MFTFTCGGKRQTSSDDRKPKFNRRTSSFMPRLFTLIALVVVSIVFVQPAAAHDADPFVVTTTADSGAGSLRQMILWANEHPGLDRIHFNIAGAGPHRIAVSNDLPTISDALIIDGATQPGADCSAWPPTLKIQLDGEMRSGSLTGLTINASGGAIRGLVISRFRDNGIRIHASDVRLQCNFIGTDPGGTQDLGNGVTGSWRGGVWVSGTLPGVGQRNVIGVDNNGQGVGNLISGNDGHGVYLNGFYTSDNLIAGNFIGVNKSGTQALGNTQSGIDVDTPNTTIGGALPAMRNLISGNANGIYNSGGANNRVIGNYVGVNAAGNAAIPNQNNGIMLAFATTDAHITGNLVSGNGQYGIYIWVGPDRCTLQGNVIGADASKSAPIGNYLGGIAMQVNDCLIGGPNPADRNLIAFNGGHGIIIQRNSAHNRVQANRIFANGTLGIDLGNWETGVTPNDAGDWDTGPNGFQNYPVLDSAFLAGNSVIQVNGVLNSSPNTSYHLEFFANAACDSSGHGEGEIYLDAFDVTTDGNGNAPFANVLWTAVPVGYQLSATATDSAGSTSEFAACRELLAAPPSLAGLPLPRGDTATNNEDIPIAIPVLTNDLDPDGDPLSIVSVSQPPNGSTSIDGGQIIFAPSANFHGLTSFVYGISDGAPNHRVMQANVQVQVMPVNDAPSDIGLTNASVAENQPRGTLVGELLAVDVDAGDSFDFFLTGSGNDNRLFLLNGRRISTTVRFDFEARSSHTIRVRVVDRAGAAFERDLAITVVNGNDAPTAITLSKNLVDENQPASTVVGSFTSSDPDAGDSHSYSLVAGAGSDDNARFVIDGAVLRTSTTLDYEAHRQHIVRVRSTDTQGAFLELAFLIAVGDQPSPPDPADSGIANCSGAPITLIDANASDPVQRVLVRIEQVVVSNSSSAGCTVDGKLTVISNGNQVSDLAFSGVVNARNEFTSSTIPDFLMKIAGLDLRARKVTIGYYSGRPQLNIGAPRLQVPGTWGGLGVDLPNATLIDSGGVRMGGAFKLPTINTESGYRLILTGSLVPAVGGYEIVADGELTIPNIGDGQSCGLSAGVTIFVDQNSATVMEIVAVAGERLEPGYTLAAGDPQAPIAAPQSLLVPGDMALRRITLGFHCSKGIPLGSTGLFLTAVKGTVLLNPNEESVEIEMTIITGQKTPNGKPVATMDGEMKVFVKPAFRLDMGVALQLMSFGLVQADASVTETSFRTTLHVSAAFIRGSASISAWSTDNNQRWHFTGSAEIGVVIERAAFGEICVPLPCVTKWCHVWGGISVPCELGACDQCAELPPDTIGPIASAGAQVGEFTNGRYGLKGYADVLGKTMGFFVDDQGTLTFTDLKQYALVAGPTQAAAYAAWRDAQQLGVNAAAVSAPFTFVADAQGNLSNVLIATPLDNAHTVDLHSVRDLAAGELVAADVISKVNLLRNADVAFMLDETERAGIAPLGFSLIPPVGPEITAVNYQSHPIYHVAYEHSERYVAEHADERIENWPRLRFTHAAPDASLAAVDVRVDGAPIFASVDFTSATPLGYLSLAPGSHTLEIVESNSGVVRFNVALNLVENSDSSAVIVGSNAANSALLLLADDNNPPDAFGSARLRVVNGSTQPLQLYVDGNPVFGALSYGATTAYHDVGAGLEQAMAGLTEGYGATTAYHDVGAGSHQIEFRNGAQVVGAAQSTDFDDGDVYTFFVADKPDAGATVMRLQRLDAAFEHEIHSEYAVDQADMGNWQVKLTGDTASANYLLAVVGPSNPPVLGSLTVDAGNLQNTQVGWRLTADSSPVKLSIYVTPDPITRTLTVTDEHGVTSLAVVPAFEGFAVAETTITDPAQLGGAPASRTIDLSGLESGDYHLFVRAEDSINPPVSGYASPPTLLAVGLDGGYGVQAVRVAQAGYDALAQLASAALIHIDHAGDFPVTWDAAIRTNLDPATSNLYVEWNALRHPDVDTYALWVDDVAQHTTQVIDAGGAVARYDAQGNPQAGPIAFATFSGVEQGHLYNLTVVAQDTAAGRERNALSLAASYQAPIGDFRLSADAGLILVPAGAARDIAITLQMLQPLIQPQVGLTIDLSQTPPGVDAGFVGDNEGLTTVSAANPTVILRVSASHSTADGNYIVRVVARNGNVVRSLDIPLAVGKVSIFLPVVTR